MYGLAVIEVMTLSGHLSNIDEIMQYCAFIKFWSSENFILREKKIEIYKEKKIGKNSATFFSPCAFILSCAFIYLVRNFCPVILFHIEHLLYTQE